MPFGDENAIGEAALHTAGAVVARYRKMLWTVIAGFLVIVLSLIAVVIILGGKLGTVSDLANASECGRQLQSAFNVQLADLFNTSTVDPRPDRSIFESKTGTLIVIAKRQAEVTLDACPKIPVVTVTTAPAVVP